MVILLRTLRQGLSSSALNISPVNSLLFQLYIPVIESLSASRIHCGRAALIEHFCAHYKQYFLLLRIWRMKVILDTSHKYSDRSVLVRRRNPRSLKNATPVRYMKKSCLSHPFFANEDFTDTHLEDKLKLSENRNYSRSTTRIRHFIENWGRLFQPLLLFFVADREVRCIVYINFINVYKFYIGPG